MSWFEDNKKRVGDIITTRIHEVLKTGVKVSIDKDKKLISTIKKADLQTLLMQGLKYFLQETH